MSKIWDIDFSTANENDVNAWMRECWDSAFRRQEEQTRVEKERDAADDLIVWMAAGIL